MFSIGDNVGIGKPAIWSRGIFEYVCVVYILAVDGPSSGRRVTPPLRAYTFIINLKKKTKAKSKGKGQPFSAEKGPRGPDASGLTTLVCALRPRRAIGNAKVE